MTEAERDLIGAMRTDLAALGRDMAYVQKEIGEMRAIFARLVWLVIAGVLAGFLKFALEGGLNAGSL